MADEDRQKRIRELEQELTRLKGESAEPLTPAEIREMPQERVVAEWERVKASLAAAEGSREAPADGLFGISRLASARRKEGYPND